MRDGETGLRVDGASVDPVAGGLVKILSFPSLAEALGERGRERALREFAWERVVEQVEAIES